LFIVIAFFGVMGHLNRMVFGATGDEATPARSGLPFSCRLILVLAAVPVLVLGVYVPSPLHALLEQAAAVLTR